MIISFLFAGFLECIFVLKLDFKHRAEAFDEMFVFSFSSFPKILFPVHRIMWWQRNNLVVDDC